MQFNSFSSTPVAGAPSTTYSTSSPSSQLPYRHTPGPFSTDQYSSYSPYSTPVTEYPPYLPYSTNPGLSAASYDPAAATASPTLAHPQRPPHQQPQPQPHYAFPSPPATTDPFPSHSHSLDHQHHQHHQHQHQHQHQQPQPHSHSHPHHPHRDNTRRISVPLSASATHTPPMYSPTSYSAQGPPQWHRDRSGSFPDPTYHHPAVVAAAAAAAAHGLAHYDSSPLSTANAQWQPQQSQQQQFGASPTAQTSNQLLPHVLQHPHTHTQPQTQQQTQFQPQPLNSLPSIARPSYTPSTTGTGTRPGTGSPEAEPQSHLQSTSMIPSVYNAGYPYYAQPAAAPVVPATATAPTTSLRTSPHTSTSAYPSLNTDVAASFNTGLPSSAAVGSALPSTASAPSTSLSPAISARSTSSQHSAGEGDDALSPRRRPRMRGIIPTSMRELEPNVKQEIDSWLLRYLNRLCGDAEAKDRMGHLIHQSYTSKRTQRYEQMYGWRPLKFRIEAFVNGFIDLLTAEGFLQDVIVKIPHYLNSCKLFSRFNESGNRMKSQGQTIWRVRARPRPGDPSNPSSLNPSSTTATAADPANPASMVWEFLPYERSIVGMPPLAIVGSPWQWNLKVHDHWAPRKKVQWSVQGAPSWMSLSGNKLKGTPKVGENCQVHVIAKFQEEGDPQQIVVQAKFTVQVSRALGSWKKHQPSVSVMSPSQLQHPHHHHHRTSTGTSEAASPTDLQELERIVGQQQQQQLRQPGPSVISTAPETPDEGVFVFGQYLSQIPQAQVARAY